MYCHNLLVKKSSYIPQQNNNSSLPFCIYVHVRVQESTIASTITSLSTKGEETSNGNILKV